MRFNLSFLKNINLFIIVPVAIISISSIILLYFIPYDSSVASINFPFRQFIGIVLGTIFAFFIYKTNLSNPTTAKIITVAYWTTYVLLFILIANLPLISELLVVKLKGVNGWIKFPFTNFTFQPVEFMKVLMLFKLSIISEKHLQSKNNDLFLIRDYVIYALIPIIFVLLQTDLGGAILLAFPAFIMLLLSLKNTKFVKISVVVFITFITLIMLLVIFPKGQEFLIINTPIASYQLSRIDAWLKPFTTNEGFQLAQALILMGSAGPFGHGLNYSGLIVPESYNDFIFASFVGFWGYVPGIILILLYFVLLWNIYYIARNSTNVFNKYLTLGIWALFFLQILENIGMVVGLLPITGIVLPFLSYGISAMISFYAFIGILLNIYHEEKKSKFKLR